MELVGVAASITQLVDITAKTVQYLNSVKDASKERLKVAREASGLLPLLWDLQSHVDASRNEDRSRRVGPLAADHGAIDQLREALEELARKLEPKKGFEDKLQALVWPLDKAYTQELLRKIERVKSSVSIALQGDTLDLARATDERTSVILSDVDKLKTDEESRRRREVLEWLSPLNFFKTQQDTFARREEGTGQWFIDSPEFQEWLSGTNRTLCCPGIPGTGKSILASVVIDFLRARYLDHESVGVAAIYCNFKERGSQNPENLLAGCCAQIIQQELPEILLQVHSKHNAKKTRPTWEEMVEILESTVGGLDTAYLVVDALDELSDDVRNIILPFLRAPPPNIRLLVTTRHKVEITSEFDTFSVVQIRANLDDLKLYVKSRITSNRRLSGHILGNASLERDICDGVIFKADGMFLAAKLHLDALSTKTSIKMLKKALGGLSNDIDDLYDDALSRIMSQNEDDRTLAEKALRWVAFAYRPLGAKALQEAVAIEPGEQDFDLDAIPGIDLVLDVCAGLLILDEKNDVVRLVHYTAQGYFDKHARSTFDKAHNCIARECMTYLSYECFQNPEGLIDDEDSLSIASKGSNDDEDSLSTGSKGSTNDEDSLSTGPRDPWVSMSRRYYYLFTYASLFWAQHATTSQDTALSIEIHTFLARVNRFDIPKSRWGYYSPDAMLILPPDILRLDVRHPYEIAAVFGLHNELEKFCEELKAANALSEKPLASAARNGQARSIEILLDFGVEINSTDVLDQTALMEAARFGQLDVLNLLLARGIDSEARNWWGWTALRYAVEESHESCVLALLDHGADINSKDGAGGTALMTASMNGDLNLVNLFLARGVDVQAQNCLGRTALLYAAKVSNESCLLALLDHGADINVQDNDGFTALHIASAKGDKSLTAALLKHSTSKSSRTKKMCSVEQSSRESWSVGAIALTFKVDDWIHCDIVRVASASELKILDYDIRRAQDTRDVLLVWKDGLTALDIASLRMNTEIIHLLKSSTPPVDGSVSVSYEAYLLECFGVASIEEARQELKRISYIPREAGILAGERSYRIRLIGKIK